MSESGALKVKKPRRWKNYFIIALTVALLLVTGSAYFNTAKYFRITALDVVATVAPNGDLQVHESREFKFKGDYTATWINFGRLHDYSQVDIQQITSESSAGTHTHTPADFLPQWRDEGGPEGYRYSFDEEKNTVYMFFPPSSGKHRFSVDYVIRAEATKYRDAARIHHVFLAEGWDVPTRNVNVTLKLPDGANPDGKQAIYAWGHGPLSGEVEVDQDKHEVRATVGKVGAGERVDLKVLFPAEWLTQVADDSPQKQNQSVVDATLAQEAGYADSANEARTLYRKLVAGTLAVPVAILLLMLLVQKLLRIEARPTFHERYWRDRPSRGLANEFGITGDIHPAVVGFNRERGDITHRHFNANLVSLVNEGWITLNEVGPKRWELVDQRRGGAEPSNLIDIAMLKLIFDVVGEGRDRVTVQDFKRAASHQADAYDRAYKKWRKAVTSQARHLGLGSRSFKLISRFFSGLGDLLIIFAVIAGFAVYSVWGWSALVFLSPAICGFLMNALANTKGKRSRMGVELEAYSQGLENWLRDFTALEERPPSDEKVWGYFLVYATVFGISQEVLDAFVARTPEVLTDQEVLRTANFLGYHNGSASYLSSPADKFGTVQRQSAIAVAKSSSSSRSGSGGGFSSGGGGGTGSGGGGGAR